MPDSKSQDDEFSRRIAELERKVRELYPPKPRPRLTATGTGDTELVTFTGHSGSGGDASTAASFAYTFTTADGVTHSSITPTGNRVRAAQVATWGLWKASTAKLYVGDEIPDGGACT